MLAASPTLAQSTFEEDMARQRAEVRRNEDDAEWQRNQDAAEAEAEADDEGASSNAEGRASITRPKEWISYAAAVAWGDSKKGAVFIVAEKYFDEQAARARVMEKCTAKGWKNCAIAEAITNGVIVVGRQSDGNLRTRWGATASQTIPEMMESCAKKSVRCKVEKVVDGTPEFM